MIAKDELPWYKTSKDNLSVDEAFKPFKKGLTSDLRAHSRVSLPPLAIAPFASLWSSGAILCLSS